MRILLTGATGLVGSALCPLLRSRGHELRALVRSTSDAAGVDLARIEVVRGNLLERESLAGAVRGVDAVIHAAGVLLDRDEESMRRVNVDGTHALLDAIRASGSRPRFVHVSTIAAGGFGTSQHPLREDQSPRPATTCGRTRLEAEEVVREHASRLSCTSLRLPLVYGPRDRLLPPLYRLIAFGLRPMPERGEVEMSLVFVEDAAEAVALVVEKDRTSHPAYYLSQGRPVAWRRLCSAIEAALGRSVSFPVSVGRSLLARAEGLLDRAPFLPRSVEHRLPPDLCPDLARLLLGRGLVCDGSLISEETGWTARTGLEAGLGRTMAWLRDHGRL